MIEPLRAVLERPMLSGGRSPQAGPTLRRARSRCWRTRSLPYEVVQESDGDVHCRRLREDFTGGPARRRQPVTPEREAGLGASRHDRPVTCRTR